MIVDDWLYLSRLIFPVRMCEDKLDLIIKALDAKPVTYRNSERVGKLPYFTQNKLIERMATKDNIV